MKICGCKRKVLDNEGNPWIFKYSCYKPTIDSSWIYEFDKKKLTTIKYKNGKKKNVSVKTIDHIPY
jgi:hypothetical protein